MTTMFEKKRTDYAKVLLFSLIRSFWQLHDFEQASVMSAKKIVMDWQWRRRQGRRGERERDLREREKTNLRGRERT
jgi:hypothetical protein